MGSDNYSINDFIERKGEQVLERLKNLVIEEGVTSLEGLQRFYRLERLEIQHNPSLKDHSQLSDSSVQKRVKELRLMDPPMSDISFIASYENLESITLDYTQVKDFSPISSHKVLSTLKSLIIDGSTNELKDINFLSGQERLEQLTLIDCCKDVKDFSPLEGSVSKTLKELVIRGRAPELDGLRFLRGYERLETLHLRHLPDITNLKPLGSEKLKGTLKELLFEGFAIDDLSFLKGYRNLQKLSIGHKFPKDLDTSPLGSPGLSRTLRQLYIDGEGADGLVVDLSFLRKYKNLEDLTISSYSARSGDFSPLHADSLKSTLRSLALNGPINKFSFLNGYENLETLSLHSKLMAADFSGVDSECLKATVKSLDVSGPIKDVNFLRGYLTLEHLTLASNGIRDVGIEDFSAMDSEFLRSSLKRLQFGAGYVNRLDISLLKDYKAIESLDIEITDVKDISDLLGYEFVRNGSLKRISLPVSINWLNINNGNAVMELKRRGVDVMSHQEGFELKEAVSKSIEDYLSKELKLHDKEIEMLSQTVLPKLMYDLAQKGKGIALDTAPSAHEVLHVQNKDGQKLILKLHNDKTRAVIEQAANYHLPKGGLDFIVPAELSVPFEHSGLYITVQKDVSDETAGDHRKLSYYVGALAKLHAHAKQIMSDAGLVLPTVLVHDFKEVYDIIRNHRKAVPMMNLLKVRGDGRAYAEAADMLAQGDRVGLHFDPRSENRMGKYFLDLEWMCTGSPALDLSNIFNDPLHIVPENQRRAYLQVYQKMFAAEKGLEYKDSDVDGLMRKVKAADLVRHASVVEWNLRRLDDGVGASIGRAEHYSNVIGWI